MLGADYGLCIPLYVTAKNIRNIHNKQLKKLGLTFTQFVVLIVLWEEGPLLIKEIGKKLDLDSGTLTPLLKKLEEKGYVIRKNSQEDARDRLVILTKEGQELRTKVDQSQQELVEGISMSPETIKKIQDLFEELLDSMGELMSYEKE